MDEHSNIEQRIKESYFDATEQDMGHAWRRVWIRLFLRKFWPVGLGMAGLMAGVLIFWLLANPGSEYSKPGPTDPQEQGPPLLSSVKMSEQKKDGFAFPVHIDAESHVIAQEPKPDGVLERDGTERRIPGIERLRPLEAIAVHIGPAKAARIFSGGRMLPAVMSLNVMHDTIPEIYEPQKSDKWATGFGIYAGASYEEIRLTGSALPQAQLRVSQEAGAPGYEAGIELTAGRGRFFTGIGLRYKLYQQRAVYNIPTDIPDPSRGFYIYDTNYIWVYDPPQAGVPVIVSIDSSWVVRNKILEWNGTRRITRIEVPFFFGYTGAFGKTSWEAALGGALSVLIQTRGAFPGIQNDTLYQDASLENFHKSMAFKAEARLGTIHEMGNRWQAFSRLTFGMLFLPYKPDLYPVKEYHFSTGLQIGVRYQLNKTVRK
jgi:hypothetical protein